MLVCVECGEKVTSIYSTYGKDNIVLDKCKSCGEYADKYVEFDAVVKGIDLILHKPPVYRHLLNNDPLTLTRTHKFLFLILNALIDVYIQFPSISTVANRIILTYFIRSICGALLYYLIIWMIIRSSRCTNEQIESGLILATFPRLLHVLFFVWDYDKRDRTLQGLVTMATLSSQLVAMFVVCGNNLMLSSVAIGMGYLFRIIVGI